MKAALLAAAVLHALAVSAGVSAPDPGIVAIANDAVADSAAVLHAPAATAEDGGYEMQFLPQVIPPTPQAAALARYGEYPVSHSTGIPDITIPLYEIDLGGYKLPISISYHASGFRPDDVATPVGLGWVLNAGGAVTRTIMGAPDFQHSMYNDTLYRDLNRLNEYLHNVSNTDGNPGLAIEMTNGGARARYDTESDRYSFNFAGNGGIFRYSHVDKKFYSLNHTPISINHVGKGFSITDSDGTRYEFFDTETTGCDPTDEGNPPITAWNMTRIATPYGEINLEYKRADSFSISKSSQVCISGKIVLPNASYAPEEYIFSHNDAPPTICHFKQRLLTSISWNGGKVIFEYESDNQDIGTQRLSVMSVIDPSGGTVKTVTFKNSTYCGTRKTNYRRILKSIHDSRLGEHSFSYNLHNNLPDYDRLTTKDCDHWGYYRGESKGVALSQGALALVLSNHDRPEQYIGMATDRSPSLEWTKACILTSISYPTGGYSNFEYELNQIGSQDIGGLRIKAITTYDGRTHSTRNYGYNGAYMTYPDPDECSVHRVSHFYIGSSIGAIRKDHYYGYSSPIFSPYGVGSPVTYTNVSEKLQDKSRIEYLYNIGVIEDSRTWGDSDPLTHPLLFRGAVSDEGNITPMLEEKQVYSSNGDIAITEAYEYDGLKIHAFDTGVRMVSQFKALHTYTGEDLTDQLSWYVWEKYHPRVKTTAVAKAFNRVRKRVTDHVTGVVTEETFTYDPQLRTLKPRSVTVAGSDGSRDSTRYEFPFDRADSVARFMAEYMPDAVMSVRRFRDGVPAQRTEYSYGIDGTKYWGLLSAVSTAYGDAPLQERERVLTRGAGCRPTAILVNATDTTRIGWDTTGLYPLKIIAPGGLTTRYEWKPLTGVTMTVDPRDYKVAYGYDSAGRLTSVRDARGTLQTFAYSLVDGPYGQQSENSVTTMRHINASGTRVTDRQYHDALGRPTLLAQGGMNTAGTYVYTLQTYDDVGRVADTWLPVGGGTSLANQTESSIAALARSTYSDSHAYSTATYDGAGRPVRTTTPGDLWHAAGKGRDVIRLTNAANSVRRYSAPVDRVSLVKEGYYPAGSLHGEKTVDEDGRSLTVFTDKYGRKVLERRGAGNDTYFVYNIYGQLRYVLSPEYQTAGYKDEYAYEYRYDARGNVIKKYIPGCGYTQYWYDRADRLTFMQDPTLRDRGLYRFFLYDRAGRLAVQGTCPSCTRSETPNPVTYRHGAPGVCATGYVMKDASRISAPILESATYYDSYTLPFTFNPLKLSSPPSAITTGLPTATMSRASDGTTLRSITYYDGFGRVNEVRSTGLRGKLAISNTSYSYTDKPIKTRFREGDVTVTTDLTYDPATDLLLSRRVMTNVGNGDYSAVVATYAYDAIGRIAKVTLGNSAGAVEYTRDLHGRLRSVTHPSFSQRLFYADGPGTRLYNGSVSSMMWLAPGHRWRGYKYTYNNLGWLTKAEYGENETITTDKNHYTVSLSEYTENGSIRRIQRHGLKDDSQYGKIDNLHLRYDGNRLVSVEEDADPVTREGANDFNGRNLAYTYNSTGALTSDRNRGISKITYDNLNRPTKIGMSTDEVIDHVYSPDGIRLRTVHNTPLFSILNPTVTSVKIPVRRDTLEYSGPVVYENGKVKRVLFDGGYATFSDAGVPGWHYFLCDHTGSVRVVADMWGRPEQINHYYPFGLPFADAGKGADLQPYKFGGKELDAMYGLHTYDFHARTLIPDLCRFDRPDPLCEENPHLSPYLFCANDPVNNTDPTGMDWISATYDDDTFFFWDERITSQADITKYYGSENEISYLGEIGVIFQLNEDGSSTGFSLFKDGSIAINGQDFNGEYDKGGLHIGSTNIVSTDKISANWYGSYLGDTNPKSEQSYYYAVPPTNALDYAAFCHDRAYDVHGASGVTGALFDTSVAKADLALAKAAFNDYVTNWSLSKRTAWGLYTGLVFSKIGAAKLDVLIRSSILNPLNK